MNKIRSVELTFRFATFPCVKLTTGLSDGFKVKKSEQQQHHVNDSFVCVNVQSDSSYISASRFPLVSHVNNREARYCQMMSTKFIINFHQNFSVSFCVERTQIGRARLFCSRVLS